MKSEITCDKYFTTGLKIKNTKSAKCQAQRQITRLLVGLQDCKIKKNKKETPPQS